MTAKEAVEKMKELAGDRDWSLKYEFASYHPPEIHGYIEGVGQCHAAPSSTYQGAIRNVLAMMEIIEADPAPEDVIE